MVPLRAIEMKRWITLLSFAAGAVIGQGGPPSKPAPAPAPAEAKGETPEPVAAAAANKAIPQAYSEEHYASTWSRNPFLIETAVKGPSVGPGFAEDWELRGLTRSKGEPEALLGNKKTQEFRWVKKSADKDGFKLVKANIDRDLHKSSVEVEKAGESSPATFTFPEVAAAPQGGGRPPAMPQPQGGGAVPGGNRPGFPAAAQPNANGAVRPGMPMPQPAMAPGAARANPGTNPAIRTNGAVPMPSAQPSPAGRRRVLIPPTTPGA